MKEYYCCADGVNVVGPHSVEELSEMIREGVLAKESFAARAGDQQWVPVMTIGIVLDAPKVEEEERHSLTPLSEEQVESLKEAEEEIVASRKTKHGLIRDIRGELDRLWAAQREAIISRIKCHDLDTEFQATRKQHKDIFSKIETDVLDYWRKTGVLNQWVQDMTWNNMDLTFKLKGTEEEKFEQVNKFLVEKRLSDLPGVYCFKDGKDYIYVGQGKQLGARIKAHEQKVFFSAANSFRIVVPQNKRFLNSLERLIILDRQPRENRSPGPVRGNPADECLEFIRREIKELITDF